MASIGFKKARCKDCYKCVRVCPVKAIHVKSEHAMYVADECILCGQCLKACPQNTIVYLSDMEKVKAFIQANETVIASLDPAYLGIFGDTKQGTGQLRNSLYKLGFTHVRETAEGAAHVTRAYEALIEEGKMKNIITSACPAVNELVEKYYPEIIPMIAPVISPMIAHGQMLKEEYGPDAKVVYIGSCAAHGREARLDSRTRGVVDAVLDFTELFRWLEEEQIDLKACEFSPREGKNAKVNGLYGVSGGILASIDADKGFGKYESLYVDGLEPIRELFECLKRDELENCVIELSTCVGGCINGPLAGGRARDRFRARIYTNLKIIREFPDLEEGDFKGNLTKAFRESAECIPEPSEEDIQAVLRADGKDTLEKQLNCGACGFKTCRERAIAVCQGKDQLNMCIPSLYQRTKSMSDVILSVMPSLIITVDEDMTIKEFNNAAEVAWKVPRDKAIGRKLDTFIPTEYFEKVFREKRSVVNLKVSYDQYQMVTMQNIIYMREQNLALGIFRDITAKEKERARHKQMKLNAVDMAQKVIDKQMMVAQEIAGLLGETTAETKMTLTKMRDSIIDDGDDE